MSSLLLGFPASGFASGDIDAEWRAIIELDAGPRQAPRSRAEAASIARLHLERQETALRGFILAHPADRRHFDAQVRLSDVLAAESRLLGSAEAASSAVLLLDTLESDPAAPSTIRADAAYARVSHLMQDTNPDEASSRDTLIRAIRRFDSAHPTDRRVAGLLAEVATLYDDQPAAKKALLDEALARAAVSDAALRSRVSDDLKRLSLLGQPLNLRFQPVNGGGPFDLSARRGHIVVLLFWASWSAPSLQELTLLQDLGRRPEFRTVEFLAVSLDEDSATLSTAVRQLRINWPLQCDGRGWRGELVRSLGVNALPTTWVLDGDGKLLTLNAKDHAEEIIRGALPPPP